MCVETFIGIVCLVGAAVCYAVYRYCSENVYLKYQKTRRIKK